MRTNIFEQSTTTTTTAAAQPSYGEFDQYTNRMTEYADSRAAGGFKYKAKRIEENVVMGAFLKATGGKTCTVFFKDGQSLNGNSIILPNLPSLSPNVKAPSESNGMACKTANGNFFFYNKNQKDFLTELRGYSKEQEQKTTELKGSLDQQETEWLKYFQKQLGDLFIRDANRINQILNTIKYYIDMGGQSIWFGYLKSAINAQMRILERKRIENQKLGQTLPENDETLYQSYSNFVNSIPENLTVNPSAYDSDELRSLFAVQTLTGYPFDDMTPAKGLPFTVYIPRENLRGAKVGRKGLGLLNTVNQENVLSMKECMDSFKQLACYMKPFNDERFNAACPSASAQSFTYTSSRTIKAVKDNVAACLTSGLYKQTKENVKNSLTADGKTEYTNREYRKRNSYFISLNKNYFGPNGAFNNSAIPCAFINVNNPTKGQSVEGCLEITTDGNNTQKESTFKNNVHKLLTEARQRKNKEILENEILENKFVGILESIDRPTRKNINGSINQILSETKKYMSKKYDRQIIQENLGNVYKFITAMVGDEDDVKDMFIKKTLNDILVKKLGMNESDPMTIHIIDEVSNKIDADNIPDMITDCHYLTVQIAEAIPSAYANKLTADSGEGFLSQFQSIITGKIQDNDTSKKLISMLSGPVCETLNGIQSTMDEKLKGFQQNLFKKN